jgi:hypothetical protein
MPLRKKIALLFICLFSFTVCMAQLGEVRGIVYDKETGEPIIFTTVLIRSIQAAVVTDVNGLYSISSLKPGTYRLSTTYLGYDTAFADITIVADKIISRNLYIKRISIDLTEVDVTADKQREKTETKISVNRITPRELKVLPSVGGEPDLAQYLQVLPGVVFTGDQGGQLYIRGGSPVMNKVLLDGMVIYNPFHSIGLFSVFDADIIKNADVYTAGFGAQYGGRVSAIVDVTTRDGNKTALGGKFSINPFTTKALFEGPLKKYKEGEGHSSFVLSYKTSYLERTSKLFYPYAQEGGLPYNFNDIYGKVSFNGTNGSKLSLFGFNFADRVNYQNLTNYNWNSLGFGTNFLVIPDASKTIINGTFAYSNYLMKQSEVDLKPRQSGISGFSAALNLTYFEGNNEAKYGIEINGFRTDFQIYNSANRKIEQFENTTELAAYFRYKKIVNKLVIEPSFRIQFYASLGNTSLEPRIAGKYNLTSKIRLKGAAGFYSQNLLSAVSDRDVVNLFYGFLSGPDNLQSSFDGRTVRHKLQKARHAVFGAEFNIGKRGVLNTEVYYKYFNQLTNINRDKIFDEDDASRPDHLKRDYIIERGNAYGFDITYKYDYKKLYVWLVYSLNFVDRFDGIRTYNPHFDRRHNVNVVTSYAFGKNKSYEASARWNLGSGFPFTLTQGYYEYLDFQNGVSTDYTKANGSLGIIYDDLNKGRLSAYHRLDVSVSKKIKVGKNSTLNIIASITNAYDRRNIFYFDRVKYKRVDQLPILPSLGMNINF